MPGMLAIAEQMRQEIIARHKAAGEYTTGKTSSMLKILPTDHGFQLEGWKYSGTYEEGRQPNLVKWGDKRNGDTGFTEALLQWARAKGIQFDNERKARGWAYCVMRKISREGTKRYRIPSLRQDIFQTPIKHMQESIAEQYIFYLSQEVSRTLLRIDEK